MKERLTKNLWLRILSIALGFVIWLVTVNISNPEVTGSKTVTLNVVNGTVLSGAGKSYTIEKNAETVTVNYEVRSRDEYKIKASDFKASIDLADLYDVTGSVPVSVEVVNNKDLILGTPYARPGVIRISTEDIQKKRFELSTNTKGTPEDGYSVGSINAEPKGVNVSGPTSQIGRISSVGIEVNVDGASKDLSGSIKPVFYDANGNKISFAGNAVQVDPEEIAYTVKMLRGKSLTLNFNVSGTVADGYRYTGAECNVKSVPVIGQREVLEKVSTIDIPESILSVQGATGDRQVKVDVADYLPSGITVNGDSKVTVTLKVEELSSKEFDLTLSDITETGKTDGLIYTISPEKVAVTITGLSEDLITLKPSDLKAKIDFSGMGKGTHDGKLTLNLAKGYTLKSMGAFKVNVADAASSEVGPGVGLEQSTVESVSETATVTPGSHSESTASGESTGNAKESAKETAKQGTESSADTPGNKKVPSSAAGELQAPTEKQAP